ncbi:MAG TPA: hypothetical protein VLF66_05645, partial [Thermoanaerobaculia bacterium]|nr:hypothetical protein [Thermoanaerobaculia bacterium]
MTYPLPGLRGGARPEGFHSTVPDFGLMHRLPLRAAAEFVRLVPRALLLLAGAAPAWAAVSGTVTTQEGVPIEGARV